MSASELEDIFAAQLDAVGLDGYVREYQAIPGRRYRFDFCWVKERLAVEIQGGTYSRGAHARPLGIKRDYEKGNLAVQFGWRVLQFDADMVKSGQALDFTEKMLRGDNG
jgi:very-short-patch-repair endonuclease